MIALIKAIHVFLYGHFVPAHKILLRRLIRYQVHLCVIGHHLFGTGASMLASRASTHFPLGFVRIDSVCPARVMD